MHHFASLRDLGSCHAGFFFQITRRRRRGDFFWGTFSTWNACIITFGNLAAIKGEDLFTLRASCVFSEAFSDRMCPLFFLNIAWQLYIYVYVSWNYTQVPIIAGP